MSQISLKNVVLKIKDGTETPNTLTVKFGDGNFTWDEKTNIEYVKDRGILDTVREGDDEPMDVRFEGVYEYYTGPGSTTPTIDDALRKTGDASTWTSTSADACEPYAVDLEIVNTPTCSGAKAKETLTFPDFRVESISHDVKAGKISVSGKCNAKRPTAVRAAIP